VTLPAVDHIFGQRARQLNAFPQNKSRYRN